MALDKIVFEEAAKIFFDLQQQSVKQYKESGDRLIDFPDEAISHLFTAGLAYALVTSLNYDRLRELARKKVIHKTYHLDDSLSTTLKVLTDYIYGRTESFSGDQYEQIGRTCQTAKILLEKRLI